MDIERFVDLLLAVVISAGALLAFALTVGFFPLSIGFWILVAAFYRRMK